jgi:hypothetical protein
MRHETFDEWVRSAKAVPIETEIERRGIKLQRSGAELIGPCPRCGGDDRFAVNIKKQVWNCRGCSQKGSVIDLVMLLDGVDIKIAGATLTGRPPPKKANGKDNYGATAKIVAEFEYTDERGAVLSVVKRIEFEKPDGTFVLEKDGKRKKVFPQYRPDPDKPGKLLKGVEGVRVVPYRLPDLIEALANGRTIFIVEGEAKVNLLWSWNLAATCCVGGSKKWKSEHSEFLRGADVALLPDNDGPGWEHVNKVGTMLIGIADRIRVLVLPHAKVKDDIIDWAKAGNTREQFDELLKTAKDWKPPAAPISEEEKTEAKKREDELIDALLNTKQGLEFHRKREEAVKELKTTKTAIDAELQARRDAVPLHGHWLVVPWDEPVDGDSLLRDIIRCIRRYVACTHDFSLTVALWTMFAWVHDEVAVHSPILLVTSAESESGKSTTLGLLSFLMPRAIASVDISKAALYRSIQLWQPSFLIDEFDQVLANASKDESAQELRSVINSGHTRGQGVIRCITDAHRPELFSTFAPKCIGMVGRKMPVTTLSRCIIGELRRRTRADSVEEFKHQDDSELSDLRRRLRRWAMDAVDILRNAVVPMPSRFYNRLANNWRLLFATADLCAGAEDWGDKARLAAINIEGAADKTSIGIRLLIHIKRIFDENHWDGVLSATLVTHLKEDDPEAPWAEWNKGKGLTQNSLAKLLREFGIKSGDVHLPGDIHGKGYKRSQFEPVWAAYLPEDLPLPSGNDL